MSMTAAITAEEILKKVTPKSFERGKRYFDDGMVDEVVQRGDRLFAEVLGTEEDSYKVGITFQGDEFTASCTCLYEWGGYCKHVVAVLLTFQHERELVAVRPALEELLSELDAERLRDLVFHLTDINPGLSEAVDRFCHKL